MIARRVLLAVAGLRLRLAEQSIGKSFTRLASYAIDRALVRLERLLQLSRDEGFE